MSHSPAIFPQALASHPHQLRTGASAPSISSGAWASGHAHYFLTSSEHHPGALLSFMQTSVPGARAARPQSWAGCHPRNGRAAVSLHGKQLTAQRTTPSRRSRNQPGAQLSEPVRTSRIQLGHANLMKRANTQQLHGLGNLKALPLPARATFPHPPAPCGSSQSQSPERPCPACVLISLLPSTGGTTPTARPCDTPQG